MYIYLCISLYTFYFFVFSLVVEGTDDDSHSDEKQYFIPSVYESSPTQVKCQQKLILNLKHLRQA